jgi:hypothetical protein
MPDLDLIKQGKQGRGRGSDAGRLPKGRSGPAARSPRPRQLRREGGSGMRSCFRFPASNSETNLGRGRNSLDRLASN